jgi:hypothetical protein
MGNFIALSGIIGKTQEEVYASLSNYAKSVGGDLQQDNAINSDNANCCIICEAHGNTTIFYPYGYLEWDDSSAFISKALNAPVFSFHIHDGDLWMYVLYNNGAIVDQFNPIPDYWESMTEEEIESWKGNAAIVAEYVTGIEPADIEAYLVRWDLEEDEEGEKAYASDTYTREEWQLVDFMDKLRLKYPIDDEGNPEGQTYKLWTEKLRLPSEKKSTIKEVKPLSKPWWRFW